MTPVLVGLLGLTQLAHAGLPPDTPLDALPAPQRERFEAAERAWAEGDLLIAEAGYVAVNEAIPSFDRAWRRRCGVVLAQDRAWEAVEHCERALSLVDSAENRTALAHALIRPDGEDPADDRPELGRAKELLDSVIRDSPDYPGVWPALCSWAMEADDDDALGRCVERLEADRPSELGTLYYRAVLDIQLGAWEHAANTLASAKARGLSEELYEPLALRLQTERGPAQERGGPRVRTVANLQPRTDWTWADVIPLAIAGLLVLVVFVVAFFGGEEDDGRP
jgi:hypothetical protein